MTQNLSTLVDGELDTHASEQAIKDFGSPEGRQAWETYHMIGEVMREGASHRFDISDRVMNAIDEQKVTVLAPGALKAKPKPKPFFSFARIALAAAASVATIGVVGWIGTQGVPGTASPTVAQGGGVTMQANVPVELAKHQEPGKLLQPEPAYAAIEVNDYLAAHRQVPTADQYRPVAARTPAR